MKYNAKVVPFDRSPEFMHHRALKNMRDNNAMDALQLLRSAVERSPENSEYRLDLAELYCEMGCHEQSSRLLLDMLARDDAPDECYYGLALNLLGMNDMPGARRALLKYETKAPKGALKQNARRLADEIEIFKALSRPMNRRAHRAMCVADHALDLMRLEDFKRARRLFERCLTLDPTLNEMRALYAMDLILLNEKDKAVAEAQRAINTAPSVRAMCVAAQVFNMAGESARSSAVINAAIKEHPTDVELRMLLYSLCELSMHSEVAEQARRALIETPYDRQLLHMRAVALSKSGADSLLSERIWRRIMRIDPNDTIAAYYHAAAAKGEIKPEALQYAYAVPHAEAERRLKYIAEKLELGFPALEKLWKNDAVFKKTLLWCASSEEPQFSRAAYTVLAALSDDEAEGALRALFLRGDAPMEIKLHASSMLRMRGADMAKLIPPSQDVIDGLLPDAEFTLRGLPVSQRQLVRYASEVLEHEFKLYAMPALAILWSTYRRLRVSRFDPFTYMEEAAGALIYCYMHLRGEPVSLKQITKFFKCSERRLMYYASRMAQALNGEGDEHEGD